MIDNRLTKRLFIVGCPRSGTTLLQNVLLNIPSSYSMPETHFFDYLPDNYYVAIRSLPPLMPYKYPSSVTPRAARRIMQFLKKGAELKLEQPVYEEVIREADGGALSPAVLFDKLLKLYAHENESVLIEKSPSHAFHISYIKSLFPEAPIINIVRDPRDTYLAFNKELLAGQGKGKRSIHEFCFLWNVSVHEAEKSGVRTIIFEKFIAQPLEEANKALTQTGYSISAIDSGGRDRIVRPGETWHKNIGKAISPDFSGQYKKNLSQIEVAEIEALCGDTMKKYGYTLEGYKRNRLFSLLDASAWWLVKMGMFLRIIKNNFKNIASAFLPTSYWIKKMP